MPLADSVEEGHNYDVCALNEVKVALLFVLNIYDKASTANAI